jgi:ribosomal protein L11 methyltransferase
MRRVRFEVPAGEVERVLDGILPLLPSGARTVATPGGRVEVTTLAAGARMPARVVLEAAAGRSLEAYREDDVPADWRLRRARTDVLVAGRAVLRAPEDPEPADGVLDVLLGHGGGFGSGAHPTTRMCVELMLDAEPAGSFGDVGCGLGALAILAAKLGFDPVVALDREPAAVEATRANAELNGVAIECRVADAEQEGPPAVAALAVNAPPPVHRAVAQRLDTQTQMVVASGAVGPELDAVVEDYAAAGLEADRRLDDDVGIWSALLLRRSG